MLEIDDPEENESNTDIDEPHWNIKKSKLIYS